jgi:hypothetical protein
MITVTVTHIRWPGVATKSPIRVDEHNDHRRHIGTEITLLITAVQNNALIGSIGE